MENYLENNMPFKILLIVDNYPTHLHFIGDLCSSIKVMFLPPNMMGFFDPTNKAELQ
jgi:hypothetical protein